MTQLARYGRTLAVLALGIVWLSPGGCTGKRSDDSGAKARRTIIQDKGSDTMVNVAQIWAEEYREVAPGVEVEVSGGGSGVGIAALIKGAVDMANASREMKPEEIEATIQNNAGKTPEEFVVGYDALAVYVNKDNPLNEISLAQLAQIYVENGSITRWSQLGITLPEAKDDTIILVSRQSSSGTYEFFREHVLGNKDYRLGSRDLNGSKEVVELVGNTLTAIGYSGMGYATADVKMLKLSAEEGAPAFAPTVENAMRKQYPLARSLQIYTLGEPQGALKEYIDWILSDPGQKILADCGYVPLTAEKRVKR
jgi:phosphate transport system substrate-binding protein